MSQSTLVQRVGFEVPSLDNKVLYLSGKNCTNEETLNKVLVSFAHFSEKKALYVLAANCARRKEEIPSDKRREINGEFKVAQENYFKVRNEANIWVIAKNTDQFPAESQWLPKTEAQLQWIGAPPPEDG